MFIRNVFLAAIAATSIGSAAGAATLLIDFEGEGGDGGELINNGPDGKLWAVGDYIVDPVNLQGGLCSGDLEQGVNSECTIESGQTVEPMLFREDGEAFDLYSFYFLNNGAGSGQDNSVSVSATFLDDSMITFRLFNGLAIVDGEPAGDTPDGVTISLAPFSPTGNCEDLLAEICKGTGYLIDLGDLFTDVVKVNWSAEGDANARLDDFLVNDDPEVEVPLPGSLPLLAGAIGVAAVMRRRKRA